MFLITREAAGIEILLEAKEIGGDFLLTLTGGKKHIGAVAVGLFDEKSRGASSSVLTIPGHREEQLALQGARQVSKITKKATVFVVGIHKDNIDPEEITEIVSSAEEMVQTFIDFYKKSIQQGEVRNGNNGRN